MTHRLDVPEELITSIHAKQSYWNDGDTAYDEVNYLLRTTPMNDFTRGYLYGRLDDMDSHHSNKELLVAFYDLLIDLSLFEKEFVS